MMNIFKVLSGIIRSHSVFSAVVLIEIFVIYDKSFV